MSAPAGARSVRATLLMAMRAQDERDVRLIAESPFPPPVEDDAAVRIEDGYWTTACLDCNGTGWFDGTHPGEEP